MDPAEMVETVETVQQEPCGMAPGETAAEAEAEATEASADLSDLFPNRM